MEPKQTPGQKLAAMVEAIKNPPRDPFRLLCEDSDDSWTDSDREIEGDPQVRRWSSESFKLPVVVPDGCYHLYGFFTKEMYESMDIKLAEAIVKKAHRKIKTKNHTQREKDIMDYLEDADCCAEEAADDPSYTPRVVRGRGLDGFWVKHGPVLPQYWEREANDDAFESLFFGFTTAYSDDFTCYISYKVKKDGEQVRVRWWLDKKPKTAKEKRRMNRRLANGTWGE